MIAGRGFESRLKFSSSRASLRKEGIIEKDMEKPGVKRQ